MKLETSYLGLKLKHPCTEGALLLVDNLDPVRTLEDSVAVGIATYSLLEEQLTHNRGGADLLGAVCENSYAEVASNFYDSDLFDLHVDTDLGNAPSAHAACSAPVIGPLSGIREGEWVHNACLLGRAGADALELNLNFVVTDRLESAPRFTDSSLFSNCAWTCSDS